jgi:two-component system sensor histidine kinase PilS (NtrC family)
VILRVCQGTRAHAATLEIHVIDDGEGVAGDLREHIFEPFFTTHSRGTGLGLYIARELCEANRARLELLENMPGAHFCIKGEMIGDSQS